jgi:hypothetical protein
LKILLLLEIKVRLQVLKNISNLLLLENLQVKNKPVLSRSNEAIILKKSSQKAINVKKEKKI